MIEQVAFVIILLAAGYLLFRRIAFIRNNIGLGKPVEIVSANGKALSSDALTRSAAPA